MLGEYLFNESSAMYCTSVLLVDHGVESRTEYAYAFERHGFTVVRWEDDLAFRIGWEDALKAGEKRPDGRAYSLQVTSDAGRLIWNNDNAGATYDAKQGWRCALEPIGGWYDKIVNLQNYYRDYAYEVGTAAISEFPKELLPSGYSYVTAVEMDGLDVTLSGNSLAAPTRKLVKKGKIYDFADDATVNPQNVKVKIARATGLVSGDFSLWTATANGAKQKELKGFKHYGVLTFGRMNGNAIDDLYADAEVLTTGFLLKPVKIPVTKKTTRTWNFSKPFDIVLPTAAP